MKYLRKFFESFGNSDKKEELQNFCNENLAYLLDEGFEVKVIWTPNCNAWKIVLRKVSKLSFIWIDIEDDFIPFFEVLDNKYDIVKSFWYDIPPYQSKMEYPNEPVVDFEIFVNFERKHKFYNRQQILNDRITNRYICSITIYVDK